MPDSAGAWRLLALLLLVLPSVGAMAGASPTISIGLPADGSTYTVSEVDFGGTSAGSGANWTQTTREDFEAGSRDRLVVESPGSLRLCGLVTEDFEDGVFNTSMWDMSQYHTGGIDCEESGGVLKVSGKNTNGGYWMGKCCPTTFEEVSDDISADLVSFGGTGAGYDSLLTLFQDGANYVLIGKIHDQGAFGSGTFTYIHHVKTGNQAFYTVHPAPDGPTSYRITYANQTACLYENGALVATQDIALTNPRLMLMNLVRTSGDTMSAQWDNVRSGYVRRGTFLSSVFDSKSGAPDIVGDRWDARLPPGTSVTAGLRSSGDPGMAGATGWFELANGQMAGFPVAGRYLQYCVTLISNDGLRTPVFEQMSIACHSPVVKVELDQGSGGIWVPANGTANWSARLHLPDGNLTVRARASDSGGSTCVTSVRVNIDTTPPAGSILINSGMEYTRNTRVSLDIRATDLSGVAAMQVGDTEDFEGVPWRPYARFVTWNLPGGDGLRMVYARFRDAVGWESGTVNDSIALDTSIPFGQVLINRGDEFCNDPNVTLSLNATDPNGVAEMLLGDDPDLQTGTWVPFRESCSWTLYPGDGERTVYARFRDAAGRVSAIVTDSILLDTTAPEVGLLIDDGAVFTRSRNVTLEIDLTENYWALDLELNPEERHPGRGWRDFVSVLEFTLPEGDGTKQVAARARDVAGNVGPPGNDSIILDTVAPVSSIRELPPETENGSFEVAWEGTDATSGVLNFDVQYREDGGSWTDWLTGTCLTAATFAGAEWHNYSFRAKATDRAGNRGEYPDLAQATIRVAWKVPPVVSIDFPAEGEVVRGLLTACGSSSHPDPLMSVLQVEIQLDGRKDWTDANGTSEWEFRLDTGRLSEGRHVLRARAFDGERHSIEVERTFFVRLRSTETGLDYFPYIVALLLAALGAGFWGLRHLARMRYVEDSQPFDPAPACPRPPGAESDPIPQDEGPPR